MQNTRRLAHAVLVFLAVTFPAVAEKVATMPAPTGYIDDYAKVLSSPSMGNMEAAARELHDKTRAQVFLVTINTLEGEPVETFANELFAKWKIGEKKTDRGVLMLFAIKDHKRWIEIGYGLEGILNDAKVGDIGREMVPLLRAQNYNEATKIGFDKICTIIAADSGVTLNTLNNDAGTEVASQNTTPQEPVKAAQPSSNLSNGSWILIAVIILWFGIIFTIVILSIRKKLRDGDGTPTLFGGSTLGDSGSSFGSTGSSFSDSSSFSSSDSGFSGGDGGSSGGGGAGGDW